MRSLLIAAGLAGLLCIGCSSKHDEKTASKESVKPERPVRTLNIESGTGEGYVPKPARRHAWTIHWKAAALSGRSKIELGMLKTVDGIAYGERANTTFIADGAEADNVNHKLTLLDHVRVTNQSNTLTCDRLVYDAITKRFLASGNVVLDGPVGSLGTFPQLIATSDLTMVGTPEEMR